MHTSASGAGHQRTKVSQGDIIHRPSSDNTTTPRWGFIVTADCDIVQDKTGARLSYLDIVTARHYLEHIWAAEALRKLRARTLRATAELITSAARSLDERLTPISAEDLLTWLGDATREEIMEALQLPEKKRQKHRDSLEVLELIFDLRGSPQTALQRLQRVWDIQGTSAKEMRARLEQALDYNKATDFHIIPEIPELDPLGYVVLLREVSSIRQDDLYASALDLQISGNAEGFYIAGSSTDNLRYAISQKMAFLFSRIGMSMEYETQCEIVTQLAVSELSPPEDFTRAGK